MVAYGWDLRQNHDLRAPTRALLLLLLYTSKELVREAPRGHVPPAWA